MEKHLNNFNLLRLIGALLVIVSHSFAITGNTDMEPLLQITKGKLELSGIGLTMFFFISGYFVTASAMGANNTGTFLKKRLYRIYPALIVLVLISVFLIGPLLTSIPLKNYFSNSESWLYLFTATGVRIRMYLPNVFDSSLFNEHAFNASLWTIKLEIQLYASMAFTLWIGLMKNKKVFSFIALLILLVCFGIVTFSNQINFAFARYLNLIGIFYFGAFIFSSNLLSKQVYAIAVIATLLSFIFLFQKPIYFDPIAFLLISISTIVYLIGFNKRICIPLETDISYGLYIYAFPIQQIIFMYTGSLSPWLIMGVGILFTIPIALVSWHLVEKKFILLKHKKG